MSQALRSSRVPTKKAARSVAAAIPADIRPLPGVAALVTFDRLAKDFTDARKQAFTTLRPAIEALFATAATDKPTLDAVTRTYTTKEAGATAQVQLRAKAIKKLSVADALALSRVKIPLRVVPGRTVVNPLYAGDGAAEGAEAILVRQVIERLQALVAANPKCGVPADFFVHLDSVNLPVEDALLRALKLPVEQRAVPLGILADIAVPSADLETVEPVVNALRDQISKVTAPAEGAAAGSEAAA